MGLTADNWTVTGNLTVAGNATVAGDATVTGDLNVSGTTIVAGGHPVSLGPWSQANATASQSAVALTLNGDSGLTEIVFPWAGKVIGISVASQNARSAGTCTVDATIDGTVTGLQAVLNGSNTTYHSATQALATADTFTAGQRIGVKVTTDGDWAAGTTPSIVVCVVVAMATPT